MLKILFTHLYNWCAIGEKDIKIKDEYGYPINLDKVFVIVFFIVAFLVFVLVLWMVIGHISPDYCNGVNKL